MKKTKTYLREYHVVKMPDDNGDITESLQPISQYHSCEGSIAERLYGKAITYCYEATGFGRGQVLDPYSFARPIPELGTFWAGNDEYESQVNYCPFCGAKAPV